MSNINELHNALREVGEELKSKTADLIVLAKNENVSKNDFEKAKASIETTEMRYKLLKDQYNKLEKQQKSDITNNNKSKIKDNNNLTFESNDGLTYKILNKGDSFKSAINVSNENLSIGKYIKGAITGNWNNAENERNQFKALSTSTGSIVIPCELSCDVIDLARNRLVLDDILVVPMNSNNLTIAKLNSDPEFKFKKELEEVENSDITFKGVTLKSKMAYGVMKISLELFRTASNIDYIITTAMATSLANMIDKAGLYGNGDVEPKGILTLPDINKIEVDALEKSKYTGFVKGIGAITKNNGLPTNIAFNSDIDTNLNMLTDSIGQPLNAPKVLKSLEQRVSNQIKPNQAIIYDRNSILMGIQEDLRIEISLNNGFKDGSVSLRVYAMLDFVSLNDKNISLLTFKES